MFDFFHDEQSPYWIDRERRREAWEAENERRDRARRSGFAFTADELADLLKLWRDAIAGEPVHTIDRLTLPTRDGGTVEVAPYSLRINPPNSGTPSPEALRAAMMHIAQQWGGKARLHGSPIPDEAPAREARLLIRAYAEVYGIDIDDDCEHTPRSAFTRDELARLPQLRAEIRAAHSDAPPERPNEEAELAAMYRRRYPFRAPAAA